MSNFSRKDLAGVGLIFGAFLVISAMVVAPLFIDGVAGGGQAVAGTSHHCNPLGMDTSTDVDLIIDNTDPTGYAHLEAVKSRVKGMVRPGQRYHQWEVRSDNNPPGPELSVCIPKSGLDANRLIENPGTVQAKYDKAMEKIGKEIEVSLRPTVSSDISPIIESINTVNMQRGGDRGQRTLIMVSDMLENTHEYSHYRDNPGFLEFSRRPVFERIRSDLTHLQVEILYLRRPGQEQRQDQRHREFWVEFFKAQGVDSANINFHLL